MNAHNPARPGKARPDKARPDKARQAPGGNWRALFISLREFSLRGLLTIVALVSLASIVEGLGLAILLPMAALIFSDGADLGGYTARVDAWMAALGYGDPLIQLIILSGVFVAWMGLRSVILIYCDLRLANFTAAYVDHLRKQVFASLAHAPWPVLRQMQKSDFLTSLTSDISRISSVVQFLSRGLVTITLCAAYVGAAFVFAPQLGVALLAFVVITGIAAIGWSRRSQQLGGKVTSRNREVMMRTTAFLDGLKAAKTVRAEDHFIEQFAQTVARARKLQVRFRRQQGKLRRIIEMLSAVAVAALLVIGYGIIGIDGAQLLILGAIALRIMPSLLNASTGLQAMAFAMPAFVAAQDQKHSLESSEDGAPATAGTPHLAADPAPAPITLEGVTVVAAEHDPPLTLLRVEAMELPATGIVLVRGLSGAGKSTFAELLAALNLPATGAMCSAGISLDRSSRHAWQSRISFAPQEPFLFSASIRENLLWPDLSAEDEAIWEALHIAGADGLVRSSDEGLDLSIRDGGNRLSGGERQRLCLARSLLRGGAVLIIDEATSAVDTALEAEIFARLRGVAQKRLIICVSHSEALTGFADKVITVSPGGVAAMEG